MAIWLHPSVTSTIVDNSGFYSTSDGLTTAFFPGFFQKGKDNELITVDGPTDADLVKKFGSIDAIEYGQTHLNLVNWLLAGGSAVVMRCLPDNAKYSHAILEVLTKESSVQCDYIDVEEGHYQLHRDYDVDGNFTGIVYYNEDDEKILVCTAEHADEVLVEHKDEFLLVDGTITTGSCKVVNVVPKITYVPSGVSKKETIEAYISNKNGRENADQYTRHILGYFIPEGRGASFYNEVRISITLASNYDSTYDFRVYSLQFEKYDSENEEWGIIYGPYYVSFDETARDFANETMFIADILDKYCGEFTFVPFGANADEDSGMYNKGFYDAAKAIAGSNNTNLRRIDILSCQEVFSEANNSFSHIHQNVLLNGGSLNLRRNIELNDQALYVEGAMPIVGSEIIVASSISRTVNAINLTSGKVSVNKAFTTRAYTDDEIHSLPEEEQEDAANIAVDAAVNGVIYVNDIKEPEQKATIKLMDNAIEKLSSSKFKLYLNKNGADFASDDDITISFSTIETFGKDESDPNSVILINSVSPNLVTGLEAGTELVKQPDGSYQSENENFVLSFVDATSTKPAHWELSESGNLIASSLSYISIKTIAEDAPAEISENLEVNDKFEVVLDGEQSNYAYGNLSIVYKPESVQDQDTIPAHWELIKTSGNQEQVLASSSATSSTNLSNSVVFEGFTFEIVRNNAGSSAFVEVDENGNNPTFNGNNGDTLIDYTFNYDKEKVRQINTTGSEIVFNAKITEVDPIDDAIIIDFKSVTQNDAVAQSFLKEFDKLDYSADIEDSNSDHVSGGSEDNLILLKVNAKPSNPFAKYLSLSEGDYVYMLYGSAGDADTVDGATRSQVATTRKNLLIKAFRGTLNPAITMKKLWPIDIVLDANYDVPVKNAINELTLSREDFMFLCDTGFCATPEQAIDKRTNSLVYNNRYTAIFTQDMRVYDEYSSKNIKVTPTYFLAKKIPYVDRAYGIHYAFVGPNRGEIEGMIEGTLSWNPTEAQKEKLYKKQLNYIQNDPNHLMFMGQLTSQKKASSLSDIPNVRALLMIRRNIEAICEEYYFERINVSLLNVMSNACNNYLGQWIANGTLSEGNVSVYASEYDMKQKLVRVQVELKFVSFLERIVITFTVK